MSEQSKENADRRDAQAVATAERQVYSIIDFYNLCAAFLLPQESSICTSWLTFTTIFV